MELILIRHGKAEDRDSGKPDAKRELTREGIEELKEIFLLINKRIGSNPMTRIWSSPLTRAVQTAALWCDTVGSDSFERYDFIADGDFDKLVDAINSQDVRSRVILFGHEPYLSEWTLKLTGEQVRFRKGGLCSIQISDGGAHSASINLTIDPKELL